MRSRISWLVLATTSAIVLAFVIPLCLLVRTLAADRAMSAADQAARNVALVVTSVPQGKQLDGLQRHRGHFGQVRPAQPGDEGGRRQPATDQGQRGPDPGQEGALVGQ